MPLTIAALMAFTLFYLCACLQMYFAMQPGKHEECMAVLFKICTKMVTDMHYDARVSCVLNWYAEKRNVRISKSQARNKHLDAWQYMQVGLHNVPTPTCS